jgi:membrane protein DedA with SNARE-associated domain
MENLVSLFVEHGLLTVFCAVLCAQLGAPIPALPFLLLAGAAAAGDSGFAMHALVLAILAALFADTLWFCIGRRYGRRVLALLCRLSISPDSCVRQSELSFARRGIATLLAAKFVPGLSILAPALAGAIGMRYASFAIFDLTGIALWAGSGIAGGLLFHEQIGRLLITLSALGSMAATVIAGLLASYVAWRFWRRWRAGRRLADVARIATDELAAMM